MKTFYIFKLNKKTLSIARKTPYNIYILLNTIYRQKRKELLKAYNLFDELCIPINNEFFNSYIYEKMKNNEYYTKFKSIHMYNDYLNDETSKMTINLSHIIIKSNKDKNIFINEIEELNDLFICDFKNNKYLINNK